MSLELDTTNWERCPKCKGHSVLEATKNENGQWEKGKLCDMCSGEGVIPPSARPYDPSKPGAPHNAPGTVAVEGLPPSVGPEDFPGEDYPTDNEVDKKPLPFRRGQFYAWIPSMAKTDPTGFDNAASLAEYATEHYFDQWRMTSTEPSEEQGDFIRPKFEGFAPPIAPQSPVQQAPAKPQGPPGKVLTPEQQQMVDQTKPPPVTFTQDMMAAWNAFQVCLQTTPFGEYVLVNNPRIGPFAPDQATNLAGWLCVYAIKAGLTEAKVANILLAVRQMAADQDEGIPAGALDI